LLYHYNTHAVAVALEFNTH